MLSVDDVGIVTYLDVAAETSMGMTRATAVGRPVDDGFDVVDGSSWVWRAHRIDGHDVSTRRALARRSALATASTPRR